MKKIFLMRHSIPEQEEKNTEDLTLSEEGIALARSKHDRFQGVSKCYSSPYRRARETASLLADRVIVADALKERVVGDAKEDFWLKQYLDHDYRNPNGESLNDVRIRMKTEIDSIIADMDEGDTVLIVSHATAICAWLMNYCEIEVISEADKSRKITFAGQIILNGKFEPADYFEIEFENNEIISIGPIVPDYGDFSLETQDLVLRKARQEDWGKIYHNLWCRFESAKYMLWNVTTSEADALERIARTISFQRAHKYAFFICEKASDQPIGFAGMNEVEPGVFEDTGIALGPQYTGKGYGTQVLNALTEEAKANGARKFIASCRKQNIASHNLQMRCGFSYLKEELRLDPRNGEEYILEFNEKILVNE